MKREEFINDLLSQMTLEEKVGQLQQCGPSIVGAFGMSFNELLDMMFDGKITQEQFDAYMGQSTQDYREEELRAGKIGSYNGVSDAATANRLQKIAVEETRLGIPLLFGCDVIHGLRTIFPIPLAESCAWDEKLWEETAQMAAREASAAGIHLTFAPMVDVSKDARWGRVSEGAGEDAYLSAMFGSSKVKGFQGTDLREQNRIMACVKHFAGYGAVEAGRDYNRVDMSRQKLYEEYLPPYKACVEAGAGAVMAAFNDINGVPCTVNQWLLKDLLRGQWGFDGLIISDAFAICECVEHGIATDSSEAAKGALKATMNIDMSSECYQENLVRLVDQGEIEEELVTEAAARVLVAKYDLGLFDHPYRTDKAREQRDIMSDENRALARRAAVKSMVLLKNDNILPLKTECRIGLIGDLASAKGEMTGAWAIDAKEEECVSLLEGMKQNHMNFCYCPGIKDGKLDTELEQLGRDCDVIVAAVGEYKNQSGEAASRAQIEVAPEHLKLLEWAKSTGKPVVAVLFNGRPLALSRVAECADAVLESWHLGSEAGNAICDILTGRENPSGKLTMSFPYTSGQCPIYYGHINTGRPAGKSKFTSKYLDVPVEPLYPFGYGLSYTTFSYDDIQTVAEEEGIRVEITVANTGEYTGEEIVQCYVRDTVGSRVRPVRQLKGFKKYLLAPGEKKRVTFFIRKEELGFYDQDMNFVMESGKFQIYVGGNVNDCLESEVYL